jgi:hypothetical protein
MRVLVCGSRDWSDKDAIKKELESIKNITVLIHGACRGADVLAGEAAKELNIPIKEFIANWNMYGLSAGPKRNQQMLDEGKPDYVLAFHDNIASSKGTKDMISRAIKSGINYKIISNKI